jgi:hypothetical protein
MKTQTNVNPDKKGALGEFFNTIGFSGTDTNSETTDELFLTGMGLDLGNLSALERRAKRMLLTQTTNLLLRDIAKADENWKWYNRFETTLLCQTELVEAEHRSHSIYCRERCCLICLANRKAQIVNTYLPIVKDMPDPHFLTITAQSVTKDGLKVRVDETVKAIRILIARYKKRWQRGKQIQFYGLWSLESNYNPLKLTYNPHIHMILPTEYAAQTFMEDWMEYWKQKGVPISIKGQKYRKVDKDREKDLIEIVKYGSKIFTEPDIAKRIKYNLPKKPSFIYVRALYNILMAMDGYDVFNTFGLPPLNLKKPCKRTKKVTEYMAYNYDLAAADWVNDATGLRLAKYKVPDELEALLASRVNTDLE